MRPLFRVLGPLAVEGGDGPVAIPAAKHRVVLAVLLARAGQVVSGDRLIAEVWPQDPPRTARNVLQGYVSHLRRLLPGGDLSWEGFGYRLAFGAGQLDTELFETLRADGERALADGRPGPARDLLLEALGLWRGPAFADVPGGPLIDAEAARLTGQRDAVVSARVDADLALGLHLRLIPELEELTALRPLDEALHRHLIIALYRGGRVADALERYGRLREALRDRLGIEPGERMRALHRAVLHRDAALDAPVPAQVQRLIVGKGERGTPPPRPAQLPPDLAGFVGREEPGDRLAAHLTRRGDDAPAPIAVITGDPGVGKSALAVRVAHRLREEFPDGQLYVDLGATETMPMNPAEVLAQMLGALGVDPRTVPAGFAERSALLRSYLADRSVLLLLDNAMSETQVRPLLPGGRGCAVLVTTRRSLPGIGAAVTTRLRPMETGEAVRLLSRAIGAGRVRAEPEQAERIAALCDGMPLALGIAAARLAARPHRGIGWFADRLADERRRLDELVIGDRAVRSSLDLSYGALDETDRTALRLLGIPDVPDLAPWLAAAVLGTDLAEAEEQLERLVEARLLDLAPHWRADAPRYRFHHLVRIFAREKAEHEETPEALGSAAERAWSACLGIAEQLEPLLPGWLAKLGRGGAPRGRVPGLPVAELAAEPAAWFDAERETLIAVVRQAADGGHFDLSWDLATTLVRYFELRGLLTDWERVHRVALVAAHRGGHRAGVACVLRGLGELELRRDRYRNAQHYLTEALEIFRSLSDASAEAEVLRAVSAAHWYGGRFEDSARAARRAGALLHRAGDLTGSAASFCGLASALRMRGRLDAAAVWYRRALTRFEKTGEQAGQATAWAGLGLVHAAQGRAEAAEDAYTRALALAGKSGHRLFEAYARCYLAECLLSVGRDDDAAPELAAALEGCRRAGDRFGEAMSLRALGELDLARHRPHEAARRLAEAAGIARRLETPALLARVLVSEGDAHSRLGDREAARDAWREARDLRARFALPGRAELTGRLG